MFPDLPHATTSLKASPAATATPAAGRFKLFGEDGLTFGDLFDLINPLQHIPVIGNIYRKFTHDVIDPAIQVAGGALYGGPLGAAFAAANVIVNQIMAPKSGAETGTALASVPTEARGGWMVATTRHFPMASALAGHDRVVKALAQRRDGALAQAAYAADDARRLHNHPGIRTSV